MFIIAILLTIVTQTQSMNASYYNYHLSNKTFFVSKYGQDRDSCGDTHINACGSMYWTSLLINAFISSYTGEYTIEMNVIDGQNETDIMKLSDNNYTDSFDPCLPITFIGTRSMVSEMIITFNSSFINTMNDWYPINSCINNNTYINEYIFIHEDAWFTMHNLIIDQTIQHRSYSFIHYPTYNNYTHILWCHDCQFNNLWFDPLNNRSLFSNTDNIHFINTQFTNITFNTLIVSEVNCNLYLTNTIFTNLNMNSFVKLDFSNSKHMHSIYISIDSKQISFTNVVVQESLFENVYTFITQESSFSNVHIYGGSFIDTVTESINTLYITNCIFSNLSTEYALINDQSYSTDYSGHYMIANVTFENINKGAIYIESNHDFETTIYILDVSISTSQTQELNENGLFQFNYYNNLIVFDNIHITYIYDLNDMYAGTVTKNDDVTNYWVDYHLCESYYDIPGTCAINYFENPVAFVKNYGGYVTIDNVVIDIDMIYNDYNIEYYNGTDYIGLLYVENSEGNKRGNDALIYNAANMNITNCNIPKSLSYTLFKNVGTLFLFSVTVSTIHDLAPNDLQSLHLIVQQFKRSEIYIYNSVFRGGVLQINAGNGVVHIYNSLLENSRACFRGANTQSFVMENCQLNHIGKFYGPITMDYWDDFDPHSIECDGCLNVHMTNNTIAAHGNTDSLTLFGFIPHTVGVIVISNVNSVSMINNTFIWDTDDMFYDFDADVYEFILSDFIASSSMIILTDVSESRVIGNFFDGMFTSISTLDSVSVENGNHCFSGNTFMAALDVSNANITSCFRPQLINCLFGDSYKCMDGLYGSIEYELINQSSNNFFLINSGIFREISVSNTSKGVKDDAFIRISDKMLGPYQQTHVALDHTNITIINSAQALASIEYGNLLLVDTVYHEIHESGTNHVAHDIRYEQSCDVVYNDRLNDINHISKLMIKCPGNIYNLSRNISYYQYSYGYEYEHDYGYNYTTISEGHVYNNTMDAVVTRFVDYSTPYQIDFSLASDLYYPGQLMKFEYKMYDSFGNNIPNNQSLTRSNIVVNIKGWQFFSPINIGNSCFFCEQGRVIYDVMLDNVNDEYSMDISVESKEIILTNTYDLFDIIGCPIGYGADEKFYQCSVCDTGKYNLLSNTTQQCLSCNTDKNNGIECVSGDIYVDYNHWIGFDESNQIISSICPASHCCTNSKQCKIVNSKASNNAQLCAKYRDPNSILCSKCKNGYSVSINSAQCVKCTQNYFSYLLIPLALALLISLFAMATNTDNIHSTSSKPNKLTPVQSNEKERDSEDLMSTKKQNWLKKLSKNEYFKTMVSVIIGRNIMYYEQSISQLLSASSISILFNSFTALFNLSTTTSQNAANAWCFINGMNGKEKILTDFFVPLFILILISSIYLIGTYALSKPLTIMKKTINFSKTLVYGCLIIIGKILDILFRILNCKKVGNKYVHFYFGDEECFGTTWILSFVSLSVIIVMFGAIFIKLYGMNDAERQNSKHVLNKIVYRYKPKYYFWELIIFIRRILIALFAIAVNDVTLKVLFAGIILFFVFIQYKVEPFVIDEANQMEIILLMSFVFIIITQLSISINYMFINIIVSILIILPFVLLTYFIYVVIKEGKTMYKKEFISDNKDNDNKTVEMMTIQVETNLLQKSRNVTVQSDV